MTTTPIGPPPVAVADPSAHGAGAATGGTGGDAFLALVRALLGDAPAPQPHAGPAVPAGAALGATPPDGEAAPDPAQDPDGLAGESATTLDPGLVPALAAGLTGPVPVSAAASEPVSAPVADGANTVPGLAGVAGGTTASTLPGSTPVAVGSERPLPIATGATAREAVPAGVAQSAELPATGTAGATHPGRPAADPAPSTSPTTGVTPPSTTTAPVTAPVAPAAATATSVAAPGQVARQVFPEVVRIATSPDGPQRVTVRLNPESLGEVRVVLTSRRGGLEVSLSAGSEARRTLVEGTPELQRLLDAVGRTDARIVVRDATGLAVASNATSPGTPGQTTAPQPGSGTPWSTDLSGGAGTWAGRNGGENTPDHGRHPLPGSSNATDGIPDATNPSPRTETVTGARPGLDVTM
jgi:flagellar hook-length control protein FliK